MLKFWCAEVGPDHRGVVRGSATQQLLRARHVGLRDLDRAGHAARDLGGLLLQVVTLAGLLAEDLARAGHAEALAGTGVALVLRHGCLSLVAADRVGRDGLGCSTG